MASCSDITCPPIPRVISSGSKRIILRSLSLIIKSPSPVR
nr:MAG TPA: hypothetical protein [Caudoviricetes sp.]